MALDDQLGEGLSPRGRGNRCWQAQAIQGPRSIPAWAGEPGIAVGILAAVGVYPRVGGGTRRPRRQPRYLFGLSPRGRGNPQEAVPEARQAGSIPAWAGEPVSREGNATQSEVYPRVGGGTLIREKHLVPLRGLSPRGRGNLSGNDADTISLGVYPRVGGGTTRTSPRATPGSGLSPRGRGNPPKRDVPGPPGGSIPAWAGEPLRVRPDVAEQRVYPRVGGGTHGVGDALRWLAGLSPRGRGNL